MSSWDVTIHQKRHPCNCAACKSLCLLGRVDLRGQRGLADNIPARADGLGIPSLNERQDQYCFLSIRAQYGVNVQEREVPVSTSVAIISRLDAEQALRQRPRIYSGGGCDRNIRRRNRG